MNFAGASRTCVAIVLILGAPGPLRAQGADAAPAGLPAPSEISGPLVRLPNGQIAPTSPPPVETSPSVPPAAPQAPPAVGPGRTPAATAQQAKPNPSAPGAPQAHGAIIIRQIANAPGWQSAHNYVGGDNFTSDRVLAGPGWTAGTTGAFANGRPVYLWIDVKPGPGRSASNGNGPQNCPNPGTSTVVDGDITWRCLTQIDYNSITGYLFDDAAWRPNTPYFANAYVVSDTPERVYRITFATSRKLASPNITCTTGSVPPRGVDSNIADGTCAWRFVADLGYSSHAGHIPKQQYSGGYGAGWQHPPFVMMTDYNVGNIWYGGVSRQEYVPGSNGETDPIMPMAHDDFTNDDDNGEFQPQCQNGTAYPNLNSGLLCGGTQAVRPLAYTHAYRITLKSQDTDSFNSNANIRTRPLAYDAANGVAIHAVTPARATGFCENGCRQHGGDAINTFDSQINFYGLQVKSDHGTAIDGEPNGNLIDVINSILDGAGWCPEAPCYRSGVPAAVSLDGAGALLNSVVILRGAPSGTVAADFHFVGHAINNTFINIGSTAPNACIFEQRATVFGNPRFNNNYCAGFTYQTAVEVAGAPLANAIDESTTLIPLAGGAYDCCDAFKIIDQEIMQVVKRVNGDSVTVLRGVAGTRAVAHAAGTRIVDSYSPTTLTNSGGNAVSNGPQTSVAPFDTFGRTHGAINLPGVKNTCSGGTASCYGISPSKQFIDATSDFRLKSTSDLRGGGTEVSVNNGTWTIPYENSADITGIARPQKGRYDIGAWQTTNN